MRLTDLPERIVIVGGGFIAAGWHMSWERWEPGSA